MDLLPSMPLMQLTVTLHPQARSQQVNTAESKDRQDERLEYRTGTDSDDFLPCRQKVIEWIGGKRFSEPRGTD
ncbi:MAG: hypothetical protein VR73_07790 [Gammaproteobacteria bacterium BRH_c0]|nr:MAG: hypothetical protein VR73_07790 [Gammaproteobacteria bacterium BRH_c0]